MNGAAGTRRIVVGAIAGAAFLLLLVMVGLATGSEPMEDYEARQAQGSGSAGGSDGGSGGRTNGESVIVDGVTIGEGGTDELFSEESSEFEALRVTPNGTLRTVDIGQYRIGDFYAYEGLTGGFELEVSRDTWVEVTTDGDELIGSKYDGAFDITDSLTPRPDGSIVMVAADRFTPSQLEDPSGRSTIVDTPSGYVRLRFTRDGIVATNGNNIALVDGDDAQTARLTEDGKIELVPVDEITADDTIVEAARDGIDLIRPDGSVVEFRLADSAEGNLQVEEFLTDGTVTELTPNDDGSYTLDDGTTVGPFNITPTDADSDASRDANGDADGPGLWEQVFGEDETLPWAWVAGGYTLLVVVSLATALYLALTRPPDLFDPSAFSVTPIPQDSFEQLLAALAADPDPDRALRRAFAVAEAGIGFLPARRFEETPFEWHRRVAEAGQPVAAIAPYLEPVCNLYVTARFSSERTTEEQQQEMVAALGRLRASASGDTGDHKNTTSGDTDGTDDQLVGLSTS